MEGEGEGGRGGGVGDQDVAQREGRRDKGTVGRNGGETDRQRLR